VAVYQYRRRLFLDCGWSASRPVSRNASKKKETKDEHPPCARLENSTRSVHRVYTRRFVSPCVCRQCPIAILLRTVAVVICETAACPKVDLIFSHFLMRGLTLVLLFPCLKCLLVVWFFGCLCDSVHIVLVTLFLPFVCVCMIIFTAPCLSSALCHHNFTSCPLCSAWCTLGWNCGLEILFGK